MSRKFFSIAVPLLIASAASALAVPTLTLESGGTTVSRTDGLDGPLDGKIQFNGSVGSFFFNDVTATTDGTAGTGTPSNPNLNMVSVDMTSGVGGTLTITFTDDGFTGSPLNMMAAMGGVTGSSGTVRLFTYVNGVELLTDSGNLSGAFDNAKYATITESSSYSLTLKAVITHGSGFLRTGFTARLTEGVSVPDGGATAIMLGGGLLALAAATRRVGRN